MTANPLAGVVGSPISGALLGLHGIGLAGWQWLFLLEGLPAIVLGVIVLWVLTETPRDASWLSDKHRDWLVTRLEFERQENVSAQQADLRSTLATIVRVLLLSLVYFGLPTCMYGVTFWLPTAIRSLSGLPYYAIGLVAVIPYLVTAVAMVLIGAHSDRSDERKWHTALPAFFGASALALAASGASPWLVIAGMSLGMVGAQSMAGPFWAMATSRTSGTAAAASIAVINSLGNLGGFFGPYIIGLVRTSNGEFRAGLLAIGSVLAMSGLVALVVGSGLSHRESQSGA
jgi:ACS family tartrate transporter-like MFS transporter